MDPLIRQYLHHVAAKIDAFESAKKELQGDSPEAVKSVRRIAHTLKGSGGTYGFPEISEAAQALEEAPDKDLLSKMDDLIIVLRSILAHSEEHRETILIVDDDLDMTQLLQILLSAPTREVLTATSANEAQKILDENQISLVILDLVLPDMDGRNFLIHLREHPQTALLPVIVLSGHTADQVKTECFALGADGFFEKPFNREILSSAVSSQLSRMGKISSVSLRDSITQLPNRASFHEALKREILLSTRERRPLSVSLIDLDHFKSINDQEGHLVGDQVLFQFADFMSKSLRGSDFLARWGGDEFVAIFPNTREDEAASVTRRILSQMQEKDFVVTDGKIAKVTFSAGVANVSEGLSFEDVLEEADRLLYHAKAQGRNCVISHKDKLTAAKTKILLADDDLLIASVLKHRLEREGFEVTHYCDGLEAFKGASAASFSLVVLDVKMPGMDGFDLLERLRKLPSYHLIPIIMLTSMGNEKDIVRGLDLGASDYILKPFSPVEFVARVHHLLKKT